MNTFQGSDDDELIKSIYAKCRAEIQIEESESVVPHHTF